MADIAQEALDSAKSAHKRLDTLEKEVQDIRGLTAAMATVNTKVDDLKSDVDEIKSDVKNINGRPARWWDTLVAALIGAIGAGVAAAILALLFKLK